MKHHKKLLKGRASMLKLLFILFAYLLAGCGSKSTVTGTSTSTSSCTATEKFNTDPTSYHFNAAIKGAQSFKVNRSATISQLLLYQTSSSGVTSMDVRLFSGGATPDAGTLLASSTVTTGLGSSSLAWVVYPLTPNPAMSPSTEYYLVFWPTGGGISVGYSGAFDTMPGENMWDFTGSTWTSSTSDINIGVTWGC